MLKRLLVYSLFPLFIGALIYFLCDWFNLMPLVRNYLPDGLWAFSLMSFLLIIWNGAIKKFWVSIAVLSFVLFEYLQSIHVIAGTGDVMDVVCYLLFSSLSLTINQSIKNYENFN